MTTVSVIGAGAWGTALAQVIADQGKDTIIWTRDNTLAREINATHVNESYLPSIALNHRINATSDLEIAMRGEVILMVTPAQYMRGILANAQIFTRPEHKFVLCSKGIELKSGKMMSEVAAETLPDGTPIAILSGPNFAHEIAAGKPAATTLACPDEDIATLLQEALTSTHFRPYITNDLIGAQVAGALKNVIAIACGAAKGMDMGESARASLVTRGLAEIARLGHAMGAQYETFLGLSGVGDMILTCSSEKSRNFSLGYELGSGKNIANILASRRNVTEGVHTAEAALMLAKRYNVEMPISQAVHKCVNQGVALDEAMHEMLNRPVGHEL